MTYIMSCVWLDYMVKYFQCKNCVGSSPKTKKCVASFLVPVYSIMPDASEIGSGIFHFKARLYGRSGNRAFRKRTSSLGLYSVTFRRLFPQGGYGYPSAA